MDTAGKLFAKLAKEADEYAARIGGDSKVAMCHEIGSLHGEYRILLNKLTPTPDKTTGNITSELDGEEVIVEYDYQPEESAVWNLDSPMCGPGTSAAATPTSVWIRGACIDAGNFQQSLLDKWEQQAIEAEQDQARDDYETHMAERGYP